MLPNRGRPGGPGIGMGSAILSNVLSDFKTFNFSTGKTAVEKITNYMRIQFQGLTTVNCNSRTGRGDVEKAMFETRAT